MHLDIWARKRHFATTSPAPALPMATIYRPKSIRRAFGKSMGTLRTCPDHPLTISGYFHSWVLARRSRTHFVCFSSFNPILTRVSPCDKDFCAQIKFIFRTTGIWEKSCFRRKCRCWAVAPALKKVGLKWWLHLCTFFKVQSLVMHWNADTWYFTALIAIIIKDVELKYYWNRRNYAKIDQFMYFIRPEWEAIFPSIAFKLLKMVKQVPKTWQRRWEPRFASLDAPIRRKIQWKF